MAFQWQRTGTVSQQPANQPLCMWFLSQLGRLRGAGGHTGAQLEARGGLQGGGMVGGDELPVPLGALPPPVQVHPCGRGGGPGVVSRGARPGSPQPARPRMGWGRVTLEAHPAAPALSLSAVCCVPAACRKRGIISHSHVDDMRQ